SVAYCVCGVPLKVENAHDWPPTSRGFLTRPLTDRCFSILPPAIAFNRFPVTCHSPDRGHSNPLFLSLREWPRLPFTARIGRAHSYRARSASRRTTRLPLPCLSWLAYFPSREGGLLGLPLRASNEGLLRPRVPRAQEINRPPSLSLLAGPSPH